MVRARPALLALVLGACPDEQPTDPLDPATIAALAEAEGDAEGSSFDGQYVMSSTQRECECRQGDDMNRCSAVSGLDGLVEVTHLGGYLTLVPLGGGFTFGMSGGVDGDGTFVLAAIAGIDSLFSTGSIYLRLDGAFDGTRLEGELVYRLLGSVGDDPLDCRATFSVTGFRNA